MYQGFGKGDGGIIGGADDDGEVENFADVCESASAEESLICRGIDSHGVESDLMLSARLCPQSGDVVWVKEDSHSAVMQRTVGMSQMTSMLHDKDRNNIYEKAIQMSLCNFTASHGRAPVVLDIGTGTGLLAMFAARHGAGQVIGCEMFEAMASIAKAVVKCNDYSDIIEVIPGKSSSIESLLPLKPDILISELLDSALLGESCMHSHADAISRFMTDNVGTEDQQMKSGISQRVMPHSAEVFATLIESWEVDEMHDVSNICMHGLNPFRDEAAKLCPGGWSLIPLQWPEVQRRGGKELSLPQKILDFEFFHGFEGPQDDNIEVEPKGKEGDKEEEEEDEGDDDSDIPPYGFCEASFESSLTVTDSGTVHGILLWWKVYLLSPEIDPERSVWYSTEPKVMNWQDHWLQVVFPLPQSIQCNAGDTIKVLSAHDALRIWLKAEKISVAGSVSDPARQCQESVAPIVSSARNGGEDFYSVEIGKVDENSNSVQYASIVQDNAVIATYGNDETLTKKAKISLQQMLPVLEISSARVASRERLMMSQCTCGWHLLCGAERIQCLNDELRTRMWEDALTGLLGGLQSQQNVNVLLRPDHEPQDDHRIILDVSDGSVLSIALALEMRRIEVTASIELTDPLSDLRIISLEKKQFSRIFHDQLAVSNDIDETLMVWDGEEWENVVDWLDQSDRDEEEDENNDVESVVLLPDISPPTPPRSFMIAALISECFYYQLHALPTWQALSFLYKRTELESKLEPQALILPGGAFIMAAAVELTDLAGTYGKAEIVSGFDHADLDAKQENWHEHMFPYKLGGYRKRLLTRPVVIASLDYSVGVQTLEDIVTHTVISTTGTCDCIAVWVDYDLTPTTITTSSGGRLKEPGCHLAPNVLRQWNEDRNDFPCHLKLNLKFFPMPVAVTEELTILTTRTSFTSGDSDFKYDFKLN